MPIFTRSRYDVSLTSHPKLTILPLYNPKNVHLCLRIIYLKANKQTKKGKRKRCDDSLYAISKKKIRENVLTYKLSVRVHI